jgi:hypothetical protein
VILVAGADVNRDAFLEKGGERSINHMNGPQYISR